MEVEGCRVRSTLKCDKTCSGSATVYREEDISVSMQTHTPKEDGACVGTEMSVQQHVPICRTSNLNPPRLTSRRSQPPLALAVPLSRFTSPVGGGSAFYVRPLRTMSDSPNPLYRILAQLESAKIYFTLTRTRDETVMILAQVPGRHYEIEVFADGEIEV